MLQQPLTVTENVTIHLCFQHASLIPQPASLIPQPASLIPQPASLQLVCLTPSLPWCHLKMANENVKFKTLNGKPSCFLFRAGMWKDFQQNV